MKTVAITGVEQCELIDKPVPHAKDDFVVVKVMSAPLCTEYSRLRRRLSARGIPAGRRRSFLPGARSRGRGRGGPAAWKGQRRRPGSRDAGVLVRQMPFLSKRRLHPLPGSGRSPRILRHRSGRGGLCRVLPEAGLAGPADTGRDVVRPRQHGLLRPRTRVERHADHAGVRDGYGCRQRPWTRRSGYGDQCRLPRGARHRRRPQQLSQPARATTRRRSRARSG